MNTAKLRHISDQSTAITLIVLQVSMCALSSTLYLIVMTSPSATECRVDKSIAFQSDVIGDCS